MAGLVHDSLSRRELAGAIVQLVSLNAGTTGTPAARTSISDSSGHFSFTSVPDGRYSIGFFHPLLDSLGLEPIAKAISVNRQGALRVDLAIPGPSTLRSAICSSQPGLNGGSLLIGVVRSAPGHEPVAGARVVGQWHEVSFAANGVTQRTPRRVTTTEGNGWFALCDVPGPGTVMLMVSRGADSTDYIEAEVPATGFLRRDLYLGQARTVANADSSPSTDTLALKASVQHLGDVHLTGTVVSVDGNVPIIGAVVGITNGPETRTNERGQWVLVNAPGGSRTLVVRAVGRYPVRRPIDVLDGAPAIRVAMATFRSVLDTLKVTASVNTNFKGFQERQRSSGMGRFLTATDIAKRQPGETSQLFRNFPGLYLDNDEYTTPILMRGVFGDRCAPAIFLNGSQMRGLSAGELDAFVRPERILGIEVYSPTSMPGQFTDPLSGCGSIVIWAR